jgi:hypothetical protein
MTDADLAITDPEVWKSRALYDELATKLKLLVP